MEWYWIAAIIVGVVLLALVIGAWLSMNIIVKARRWTGDDFRRWDTECGFGEAFADYDGNWRREPFTLESGDVLLRGEFILNPNDCAIVDSRERRRVAIVCHGHTANRYAAIKYAKIFYDAGYSVVIYDERYFGESTGRCCTLGQEEAKDLHNVIALTRRTLGEDCVIGLHGESMGGATVLLALKHDTPAFVVADCPFANTRRLIKSQIWNATRLPAFPVQNIGELIVRMRFGYRPEQVNPIEAVAVSETPICFMHGREDKLIDCSHSVDMHALCQSPLSELHLFDGADHARSFASDPQGYRDAVLAFMRRCGVL